MVRGFSLVELSIVLVILGLLTGGILAGRSLIRASELRSISADIARYRTATFSFRDKYFALPGDMTNAGKFWGYADTGGAGGVCSTPGTSTGAGTLTCDGDGDGLIIATAGLRYHESFRFWQHLANAGLIEGAYTGVQASASANDAVAGSNVPAGRLGNSAFYMQSYSNAAGNATWWANNTGNMLRVGGTVATSWPYANIFKPEEAWNIDTKMDDGRPDSGRLFVWKPTAASTPDCATTDVPSTTAYKVTVTDLACFLIYRT